MNERAKEAAMKKYPPLVDEIAVVVPGGIKYEEQDIHVTARSYYSTGYEDGWNTAIKKIKEEVEKAMDDNLSVDKRLNAIYAPKAVEDFDILSLLDKYENE